MKRSEFIRKSLMALVAVPVVGAIPSMSPIDGVLCWDADCSFRNAGYAIMKCSTILLKDPIAFDYAFNQATKNPPGEVVEVQFGYEDDDFIKDMITLKLKIK